MAKVFISHSKKDAELVSNVAAMLRNIGDEPLIMEYAPQGDETVPPFARIREYVRVADHVMLFKTDNAIRTPYTRSWIIFEVGLAAELNKRLFVLERKGTPIEFPIPYLTDYMVLDPDRVADFLKLQTVAKKVSGEDSESGADATAFGLLLLFVPALAIGLALVAVIYGALYGPIDIQCDRCHSNYRYFAGAIEPFQCPVCLDPVDPAAGLDLDTIDLLKRAKETGLFRGNGQ
jgi:hypothetical protein